MFSEHLLHCSKVTLTSFIVFIVFLCLDVTWISASQLYFARESLGDLVQMQIAFSRSKMGPELPGMLIPDHILNDNN